MDVYPTTYRILIVDDEKDRVPVITEWLSSGFVSFPTASVSLDVDHVLQMPKSFIGYDIVCLDHDLGTQDVYDVLRTMSYENIGPADFIVHSANPIGASNISKWLDGTTGRKSIVFSFPRMLESLKRRR